MSKISNAIALWRQKKERKQRQWEVVVEASRIFLTVPSRFQWKNPDVWVRMETTIFSRLQKHWVELHTYMRLYTYYVPEKLITLGERCQLEKVETKDRNTHLFLIPDCQDQGVWEAFFWTGTNWDGGRTIFALDYRPENWKEITARFFEIVQRLNFGNPIGEFEGELTRCRLLCYSVDAGLVVAKVDLCENVILSILKDVAIGEDLELVVERQS